MSGHQALLPLPLLLHKLPWLPGVLVEQSNLTACALGSSMRLGWWAWQIDLLILVVRNMFCRPQLSTGSQKQSLANNKHPKDNATAEAAFVRRHVAYCYIDPEQNSDNTKGDLQHKQPASLSQHRRAPLKPKQTTKFWCAVSCEPSPVNQPFNFTLLR